MVAGLGYRVIDTPHCTHAHRHTPNPPPPPPPQVGPRLELEVVKVEEGLSEGRVLFHKYQQRSAQEQAAQQAEWDAKEALREQRRKQQVGLGGRLPGGGGMHASGRVGGAWCSRSGHALPGHVLPLLLLAKGAGAA